MDFVAKGGKTIEYANPLINGKLQAKHIMQSYGYLKLEMFKKAILSNLRLFLD